MKDNKKLNIWQERLNKNQIKYQTEYDRMDTREHLYLGRRDVRPVVNGDKTTETPHVRNICAEFIEAQVDCNIPQPKVTARRKKDEELAKLIEDFLRNEIDRLPFEQFNDMMERTIPIQGGAGFLIEWDNSKRTHYTIGELAVGLLHPKQIVPQDGVYSGIEDMDYIILKIPQTKEYIRRKYNIDVSDESEEAPEVKTLDGEVSDDMVTQNVAYFRNEKGGIGRYSWVGDIELEDLEDYQARRLRKCKKCGTPEPAEPGESFIPTSESGLPLSDPFAVEVPDVNGKKYGVDHIRGGRKVCPYCGCEEFIEEEEEFEELPVPVCKSNGEAIGGMIQETVPSETSFDEMGLPVLEVREKPTQIPFYKPDIFPVVLQKNVSVYGKFLGDSDIDKIEDQQNTINRLNAKMLEKLLKSGSYITLPPDASIRRDTEDMKSIILEGPQDMQMIHVFNMQADTSLDMNFEAKVYEETKQGTGITDSYLGRKDTTATSGTAKQFAASQSAGRLESKRVMKYAAYAAIYEIMFKLALAYMDEPRSVVSKGLDGNPEYKEFNRYDFLEQDAAGEWCWNDQFLFSCDTSSPLAADRAAMWQETRLNFQQGTFGNPAELETQIMFWSKMETLHYPLAGETKRQLQNKLQQQQAKAAAMAQRQQIGMPSQGLPYGTGGMPQGMPQQIPQAMAEQGTPYTV